MKLGYFTMPLHPPGSDMTQTLQDDANQILLLDELGYEEAWIGEHFTAQWENIPCPDLFIAGVLAQTKNIMMGTGVTCMPNHNPFMIAHRIAQLDHMAKGRLYWGVGSGGFPGDFQVLGIDPTTGEQRQMTREAVDTVIKIWEDPEPGPYKNKYWSFNVPEPDDNIGLRLHVKPFQKPHPPIAVAGVSDRSDTLLLAGERGWIPMTINIVPLRIIKTHWGMVEEGARMAGRTPDRSTWRIAREVYVSDSSAQARKEALEGVMRRDFENYLLRGVTTANKIDLLKYDPHMPDSDVNVEYLVDNIWIVGSPDEVADKLTQLYHEVGGFGILLAMGHEWQPRDRWINSMTLLAEEVMPKLAGLN